MTICIEKDWPYILCDRQITDSLITGCESNTDKPTSAHNWRTMKY